MNFVTLDYLVKSFLFMKNDKKVTSYLVILRRLGWMKFSGLKV